MNIAFNFNKLGMEGLGPTLTSLIRNCSNSQKLTLWFLCSDVPNSDKTNIGKLLEAENYKGGINFIDFDAKKRFGHLRSLHGDWSAYGRLLIPSKIDADQVLYLDCDLIILVDVLELLDFDFSDKSLAAVYGSQVKDALEKDFFINKLEWDSDIGYFNSGVLLFNIKKWNKAEYSRKVEMLCEQYPDSFLSADQTILNAIAKGDFKYLNKKFNMEWPTGLKCPKSSESAVLHFVGSPKPWDVFGRLIHDGYKVWNSYTTSFWTGHYGRFNMEKLKRTWNIRRSVIKHLKNKYVQN